MNKTRIISLCKLLEFYSNKKVVLKEESFNHGTLGDCIKNIFSLQLNQSETKRLMNDWKQQSYNEKSIQSAENASQELRQRVLYLIKKIGNKNLSITPDENFLRELKSLDVVNINNSKHSLDIEQFLKLYVPRVKKSINELVRILKERNIIK